MRSDAAFLMGALSAAAVALALSPVEGAAAARAPSRYVDGTYGFSIDPPAFPAVAKGGNCTPAMFLAPPEGGFSPNVNVLIQENAQSLAEYAESSRAGMKQLKLTVVEEKEIKVSGQPALRFEYHGPMQGRELHWLALAVPARGRVYLATATCPEAAWAKHEKALRACLESFALAE